MDPEETRKRAHSPDTQDPIGKEAKREESTEEKADEAPPPISQLSSVKCDETTLDSGELAHASNTPDEASKQPSIALLDQPLLCRIISYLNKPDRKNIRSVSVPFYRAERNASHRTFFELNLIGSTIGVKEEKDSLEYFILVRDYYDDATFQKRVAFIKHSTVDTLWIATRTTEQNMERLIFLVAPSIRFGRLRIFLEETTKDFELALRIIGSLPMNRRTTIDLSLRVPDTNAVSAADFLLKLPMIDRLLMRWTTKDHVGPRDWRITAEDLTTITDDLLKHLKSQVRDLTLSIGCSLVTSFCLQHLANEIGERPDAYLSIIVPETEWTGFERIVALSPRPYTVSSWAYAPDPLTITSPLSRPYREVVIKSRNFQR